MGLSKDYADKMAYLDYGYGLYHPEYSSNLKPGTCGFFDIFGNWVEICHLQDIGAGDVDGWQPVRASLSIDYDAKEQEWGPKYAEHVTGRVIDLKAGVPVPTGIPVDVRALLEYKTTKEFGAILLVATKVRKDEITKKGPLRKWENDNHRNVLSRYPEVWKRGLWIVTGTWTTTECALTTWKTKEERISIGLGVEAASIADASLDAGFYLGERTGGWTRMKGKGEDRVVVFMTGLYFAYGLKKIMPKPSGVDLGVDKPVSENIDLSESEESSGSDEDEYLPRFDRIMEESNGDLAQYEVSCKEW